MGVTVRTKEQLLDEYLIAAVRIGDHKALNLLARRWQRKLVAHAWRMTGDAEMARDAAQDGWIEILRGISRLRDERAFPAWAYQIVTRRCARRIGQVRRGRVLTAAVLAEAPEPFVSPEDGDPGAAARLRKAIAELPPEQRAVIGLFYLEDLGVAEVATALNVPAGTVKTRLMHARRKLRTVLGGEV